MTLGDAGSYYCSADNGLGHVDKEELLLDVQYGPQVSSIVQYSTVQYIVQYNKDPRYPVDCFAVVFEQSILLYCPTFCYFPPSPC